jgi:hypothetical protein
MITKALLALILAACGVPSTPTTSEPPAEEPDKKPPNGEVKPIDQHWCCDSVDHKNKSGDGCDPISGSLETIAACSEVLYCPGFWTKSKGTVRCE